MKTAKTATASAVKAVTKVETATPVTSSTTSLKERNERANSVVRNAFVDFLVNQMDTNKGAFSRSFKAEDFIKFAPRNGVTKKLYNAKNHALLFCIAIARQDPRFATFKQIAGIEKTVKKGCHGFAALSNVPMIRVENEENDGHFIIRPAKNKDERINTIFSVKKWFYVFNFTDVEGVDAFKADENINFEAEKNASFDRIEALIKKYGIEIRHEDQNLNANQMYAFYHQGAHYIAIFDKKVFKSVSAYYATLLHELAHSTMKGLNRKLSYSDEELVAEISSLMLSMHYKLDFDCEQFKNSFAYLNEYAKDPELRRQKIENAVIEAEKAVTFLKKFDPEADFMEKNSTAKVSEMQTIDQAEKTLTPAKQDQDQPVQTDLFSDAPAPKTKKAKTAKKIAKSKIAARSTLDAMSKKASKKKADASDNDLLKKIMALTPEQRQLIKSLLG